MPASDLVKPSGKVNITAQTLSEVENRCSDGKKWMAPIMDAAWPQGWECSTEDVQ